MPYPTCPNTGKNFAMAQREHAFLLRCEGLRHREIAERLGVSIERSRRMVRDFSRLLTWAMRRTTR
jgi:transposase